MPGRLIQRPTESETPGKEVWSGLEKCAFQTGSQGALAPHFENHQIRVLGLRITESHQTWKKPATPRLHPSQIYQDFWGGNPGIGIVKVLEVIPVCGQVCGRPGILVNADLV